MGELTLAARLVLAALFAAAGLTKLADRSGTQRALGEFGLPGVLGRPLGLILPVSELAVAAALIPGGDAIWKLLLRTPAPAGGLSPGVRGVPGMQEIEITV